MNRFVPPTRAVGLLPALLLVVTWTATSFSQEPIATGNASFGADELVEVQVLGEWILGQVVKETAEGSGSFRVKFHHDGKRLERTYPVSRIRRKGETPIFPLSDLRKWSDSSGKHSVLARLIEVAEGEMAVFMKQDGNQIEVPLDKLAAPDRIYARKLAQQSLLDSESQDNNWDSRGRIASTSRARRGAIRSANASPVDGGDPEGSVAEGHGAEGHSAATAPAGGISDSELAEMLGANETDSAPAGDGEVHGAATVAEGAAPAAGMLDNLAVLGAELATNGNSPESSESESTTGTFVLSEARSITPDANKGWELVPKPASASGWEDLVINVPPLDGGDIVAMSLAVTRDGQRAVGQFQREEGESAVAIATFEPQQNVTLVTVPGLHRLLDVNPDGQRLVGLGKPAEGSAEWGVWSLQEGVAARQATWTMPDVMVINRTYWLDENTAITHVDDKVALLNLDPAVPTHVPYIVPDAKGLAIDATRTYVAIQRDDGVLILTAATGEQVGWIPADGSPPTAIGFSSNGIFLAVGTADSLIQFDLESGSPLVVIPRSNAVRKLDWLANDFIVVDAAELIRLGTQSSVRSYAVESPLTVPTIQTSAGAFWFLAPHDSSGPAQFVRLGLIPTELEARQADPVTNWSLGRNGKSPLGG